LRTGSANFSRSRETRQDNDLVALRGEAICAGFDAKFERAVRTDVEAPAQPLGSKNGRHSPTQTRRSGWLSPEDYGDRLNTTRKLIAGSLN
jgi:hypothetical protein